MRRFLVSLCILSLVLALFVSPSPTGAQQPPQPTSPTISSIPPTTGSLICSQAIGTSCGTTKADWVGAYKLNLSCSNGFYDPIYGGTCWKCPDETDKRGGW